MANKFSVNTLLLSKQQLTATGNNLYLNERLVGSGNYLSVYDTGLFATNLHLIESGANLEQQIGLRALKADTGNFVSKTETGAYDTRFAFKYDTGNFVSKVETGSYNDRFALKYDTGNFVSQTQTGHLNRITISGIYQPAWDFTGAGIVNIYAQGNRVFVSGAQTGVAGDFVFRNETGQFASDSDLLYASGYLVTLIQGASAGVSTLNGLSGVLDIVGLGIVNVSTGAGVINISVNTGQLVSIYQTGAYNDRFALKYDTGNFVSRTDTGQFASDTDIVTLTNNLATTGQTISTNVYNLSGYVGTNFALKQDTGNFVSKTETGAYNDRFALKYDTGNFVSKVETGAYNDRFALKYDTGNFVSKTETGAYDTRFAFKYDTGNFVSQTQTGHLTRLTVSGFYRPAVDLTGISGIVVRWTGQQTFISGDLTYFNNYYATKTDTGNFVSRTETGAYDTRFAFKYDTGNFVSKTETGAYDTRFAFKYDTGNFVSRTDTGQFASDTDITVLTNNLATTGQTISTNVYNLSGYVGTNFALKQDTGNFVSKTETGAYDTRFAFKHDTGNFVSQVQTGILATAFNVGNSLSLFNGTLDAVQNIATTGNPQFNTLSLGTTGDPLSALTIEVVANDCANYTIVNETGAQSANFVLRRARPGLSGVQVGDRLGQLIFRGYYLSGTTGGYANAAFLRAEVNDVIGSGGNSIPGRLLVVLSDTNKAQIEAVRFVYSGANFVSGLSLKHQPVLTGILAGTNTTVQNNNDGTFTVNATAGGTGTPVYATDTGNFVTRLDTGILSNVFYPLRANPSGYISAVSGVLDVPGSEQIYDGQLLIGSSGFNAFIQGGLYGVSGIGIISGSGALGIGINQNLFALASATGAYNDRFAFKYDTGNFVSQTQTGILATNFGLGRSVVITGNRILNTAQDLTTGDGPRFTGLYIVDSANPTGFRSINSVRAYIYGDGTLGNGADNFGVAYAMAGNVSTASPVQYFIKARNNWSDPTAVMSGDRLGIFLAGGYTGSGHLNGRINSVALSFFAEEDFSSSGAASSLRIEVAPPGSTSRIENSRFVHSGALFTSGIYLKNQPVLTGILAGSNTTVQNNNNGTFTVNASAGGGTGTAIYNTDTGAFANSFNLVQTGAALDNKINALSGSLTGLQTIWVPAGAITIRNSNGPATGNYETSGSLTMLNTLDFDGASDEFAQFSVVMPNSWDRSNLRGVPYWTHGEGASGFGVNWVLQCKYTNIDETLTGSFGVGQMSTGFGGAQYFLRSGMPTQNLVPAGTPADNIGLFFQTYRDADASGLMPDNRLNVDAKLIGWKILYGVNKFRDV